MESGCVFESSIGASEVAWAPVEAGGDAAVAAVLLEAMRRGSHDNQPKTGESVYQRNDLESSTMRAVAKDVVVKSSPARSTMTILSNLRVCGLIDGDGEDWKLCGSWGAKSKGCRGAEKVVETGAMRMNATATVCEENGRSMIWWTPGKGRRCGYCTWAKA